MIHSKEKLLERLRELTLLLDRYPTKDEIDISKVTPHSFSYYKYFESLNDAFKELNLNLKPRCKICNNEFINNQALAAHLTQREDTNHINHYRKLKVLKINKIKNYRNECDGCNKKFRTKKGLNNHIFSRWINDNNHLELRKKLREKRFENAKKICAVCNRKLIRNVGRHLIYSKDIKHRKFYKKQRKFVLNLFNKLYSFEDMKKFDNILLNDYNSGHFAKICMEELGKNKALGISKEISSIKSKKLRKAEWNNLTSYDRRHHPWVIAGRKASLESSKRGSKNQKYAFELLKQKFPDFDWHYNYTINREWHVDIAAPKKFIFLEWDGRHHFIPIHGSKYLNNRINRDRIKNKIVTKEIKGCLIRIMDEGRENRKFVEERINEVSKILKQEIPKGELIRL